jgi:hypothetical protein
VTGLRCYSTWSGSTVPECGAVHRRLGDAASGPEDPGARLSWLSRWRLGGGYSRVQVGSYLGHDLLGAADPRLPAAFAAGAALATLDSGHGPDGDLVPGDLLVDGDGHGSPPIGRLWPNLPTWKPVTKLPAGVPGMRSVAVALVTPRHVPVPIAALAGVHRRAMVVPKADESRKVESPPLRNREQQKTTHFC